MISKSISLEELSTLGREFYLEELKDGLEKEHLGEFAVIDVGQRKYVLDADRFIAIRKAEKEFGEKLFYIVRIGDLQAPTRNASIHKYAWHF